MPLLCLFQAVALAGGTVHPMTPGSEPAPRTVVVDGGRVVALLAPDEASPLLEGARVLDVTGMHVVPGLVDAAVHFDPDHDPLYLAAGVTLVRDTGNVLSMLMAERSEAARERGPGPELLVAGPILDGYPPSSADAAVLRDADEAREKVGTLLDAGVDYLSYDARLSADAWRATLEVARERGVPVWGPAPPVPLEALVEAGQTGLFGLDVLLPPGGHWEGADEAAVASRAGTLAQAGVVIAPLLRAYGRLLDARDESRAPELGPQYELAWRTEAEAWDRRLADGAVRERLERAVIVRRAATARLVAAGARLVPGSGAPNAWISPGEGLHDELEEWVRAGMSPEAVLAAATSGAAEALGVGEERGSIALGHVADLLVVGADPRDSLSALRAPEIVVVRGRVLERPELARRLAESRERQAERREELRRPVAVAPPEVPEGRVVLSGRSEARAFGLRVHAEAFAVVELADGRTAYCTRLETPPTATGPPTEIHLVQRIKDGLLESFDLRVRGPSHELTVEGIRIGGLMNIERRIDGSFLDNQRAREALALVDVHSVLGDVIAARHFPEGPSFALSFEGFDPVVDRWQMQAPGEDGRVQIGIADGWLVSGLDERGVPAFSIRRSGDAQTDAHVEGVEGEGLRLPPERVYHPAPEAAAPVEAGTAAGGAGTEGD